MFRRPAKWSAEERDELKKNQATERELAKAFVEWEELGLPLNRRALAAG